MFTLGRALLGAGLVTIMATAFSGCSSSDYEYADEAAATRWWNDLYGRDCFAPTDIGTSRYPLDQLDADCERTKLLNVRAYDDGDGAWCFRHVRQWSYKYSDVDGFNVSDPVESTSCYSLWREGREVEWHATFFNEPTPVPARTLSAWPI